MKMNPVVKTLWVHALRSGEYKQGIGALRRVRSGESLYCCLGVLCEVAVEAGVTGPPVFNRNAITLEPDDGLYLFDGNDAFPPDSVEAWAELPNQLVLEVEHSDELGPVKRGLITMNDDMGLTFEEIADLIEAQL